MISFENGIFVSTSAIPDGVVITQEDPILSCPPLVSAGWKKLAKKISKLEPDARPDNMPETMPNWSSVSLNEAIVRLLCAFDAAGPELKQQVLEIYNEADESEYSPFDSLIKKAKVIITKEAPKIGIKKATVASLDAIMRILTGKVCVTTDGGAVLYHQLGRVPHSCTPNCMFIPRGSKGTLVAIRDIAPGERITCSHIPTNCLRASTEIRQSWLCGVAGSRCRSECCTSGFDLRRRVICPKCHPIESRDTPEFMKSDQQDFCFAARSQETGKWIGQTCGVAMEENEALDVTKETNMVKKILFLNESSGDMDLTRLTLLTKASVSDCLKTFGKGHFSYQQLLLLECGLALHALCNQSAMTIHSRKMFCSWMKMVIDVAKFSEDTKLPFDGMDELVRILIAPETLQMSVSLIGSVSVHKADDEFNVLLALFTELVERSCACLVLIEGPESPHSSDGIKLKNWWKKKYTNWLNAPEEKIPESPNGVSFVSTAESEVVEKAVEINVGSSNKWIIGATSAFVVTAAAAAVIYKWRRA
jgi:hypothetical protein